MSIQQELTSAKNVQDLMLQDAARSALDADDVAKLKFNAIEAAEATGLRLPSTAAGYVIPYFDLDGKLTKFFRVRYLEDTRKGFAAYTTKKPLKYGQPTETVNEVYMAPFINWRTLLEKQVPLVFTEGEKKAACATKHGIPTVGLGGVWCFMSKRKGALLLPIFDQMNLEDRVCIICFDSDAATNTNIVSAEIKFAERLIEKGAVVKIARLPQDGEAKVGLDDYIIKHGATNFKNLILDTAFEYAASEALHQLNKEVVYIRNPGLLYDHVNAMKLSAAQFTQHAYSNKWHVMRTGKDGDKLTQVATAKAWLDWEFRAELQGLVYRPGEPAITEDKYLNGWQGWGFDEPKKGDIAPWKKLLKHLFGASTEAMVWFEKWLAWPIQNPGCKMATAVLVWGVITGTGKSLMGYTMMKVYGGKNSVELKDSDLENSRNEWAENKQFAMADDITGSDNRRLANKYKTMITQKEVRMDIKFIPSYSVKDCINYYLTSNEPNALFLEDEDRRFFVHEVLAGKLPVEQRNEYIKWMESKEGIAALAWHLLNLNTQDFDPYAEALETNAKREMKISAKSELGLWVTRLKEDPVRTLNGAAEKFGELMTAEELHVIFDPIGDKRASSNALARELKRAGFCYPAGSSPLKTSEGFRRAYAVQNLEKWRDASYKEALEHFEEHRRPTKTGRVNFTPARGAKTGKY